MFKACPQTLRFYTKDEDHKLNPVDMLKDGEKIPIRSSGKKSIDEATKIWKNTNTPDDESLEKVFKKDIKKDTTLRNVASQNILKQASMLAGEESEDEDALKNVTAPVTSNEEQKKFIQPRNEKTGERNGPKGPEPTRYGDWERSGRVYDF